MKRCSHIQNGKNAKGKTKIGVRKNDTTVLVNKLFSQYKQSAYRRSLDFRLTKEQIRDIIFINCYYCGTSPNNLYTLSGRVDINTSILYNGIDRVNNNLGYIEGNVVPCCGRCNRAKVMTKEEFLDWIKAVYKKHLGENK